eukprot:c18359_g2_i2 orf=244-1698(+)
MTEASDNRWHTKERSNDRDSMSEFEFAMSAIESEDAPGEHMLSADELFFKGKLLPLYTPDYIHGSEQKISKCDKNDQVDQISARKSSSRQSLSNRPTPAWALCGMHADTSALKSMELIVPSSPKAPKCSIKLRELFGFRKMAKSHCSCAASGEVNTASSSPSVPLRSSSRKQKSERNKKKTSLLLREDAPLTPCKARHLSSESGGGNKMAKARNSASEPLLTGGKAQLQYSFTDDQQTENLEKASSANSTVHGKAYDTACLRRADRVRDDHANSLCIHSLSQELRDMGTSCSENVRRSASLLHRESYEQNAGERNRGSRRPSIRTGRDEASAERISCSASNTAGSGGRHTATVASASGFKIGGIGRAKSLERSNSNSYSPKSLQRKYEQLKAVRQREGWRVLERSSSYNSSMHSMRVAPVLNVPSIVCISRSKSYNYAGILDSSGLGHHNLFSTKLNRSSSAPSSKVQQLKLLQSRRHSPNSSL